jgi:hypothetical protein
MKSISALTTLLRAQAVVLNSFQPDAAKRCSPLPRRLTLTLVLALTPAIIDLDA